MNLCSTNFFWLKNNSNISLGIDINGFFRISAGFEPSYLINFKYLWIKKKRPRITIYDLCI